MKTKLLALIAFFAINACSPDDSKHEPIQIPSSGSSGCGTYKGHILHIGEKGGCYYYNSSGNKTYVERTYCNC